MIRLIHLLGVKYFILLVSRTSGLMVIRTNAILLGNSKMTYGLLASALRQREMCGTHMKNMATTRL
jgi:hypothetical protein